MEKEEGRNQTIFRSSENKIVPFIEVYQPEKKESCILPQRISLEKTMQDFHRNHHTQTKLLTCGGGNPNILDDHFEVIKDNVNLSMPLTCILYRPRKGYIHAYDLQGRVHLKKTLCNTME